MKQREVLSGIALIALFIWGGLFLYTYQVRPSTPLVLSIFFLILAAALITTFGLLAYLLGQRFLSSRRYRSAVGQALRQSILLTFVIIANLLLRLLHSWSLLTAIVIIVAAVVSEILSLARKT
jgi:drug/metabolite transporter (DMT)-like permease